jgi:hypothetical protein
MFEGTLFLPVLTIKLLIEPVNEAVTEVAIIVPVPVIVGDIIAGLVPNTNAPVPVSPVTAAAKLADVGVPKKVATPVPNPDTPVNIGNPVAFVRILPTATVPRTGVTRVGELARTTAPVPVTAVIPVPLILRTLPVPAVSKVLFVKVSVVALPTKVSLLVAGNVKVFVPAIAVAVTVVVPEVDPLKFTLVPSIGPVTIKDPEIFTVFAEKSPFINGVPEPEAMYNLLLSSVNVEGPAENPIAILFEELPENKHPAS